MWDPYFVLLQFAVQTRPESCDDALDVTRASHLASEGSIDADSLARRAQQGGFEAFETLAAHFGPRLFRFLMRFTQNAHDAEDLTQDTLLKAWRDIARYDGRFSFSTWVYTIAKRAAYNHHRDRKWEASLAGAKEESEPISEDMDPAVVLARKDEAASLWTLARQLKPAQHEVLWLHYGEGFSVAETARIMEMNSIHVRVQLHRARSGLLKLIEQSRLAHSL